MQVGMHQCLEVCEERFGGFQGLALMRNGSVQVVAGYSKGPALPRNFETIAAFLEWIVNPLQEGGEEGKV